MASRNPRKSSRKQATIPKRLPARVAESAPGYGARICYVESSALLAALLEHDADALDTLRQAHPLVTSALTFAECARALVRAQVSGRLVAAQVPPLALALRTFSARCTTIAVTASILDRAGRPFPAEPVRTLDGIHLATLEALGEAPPLVVMLTRDPRVRANATAMGFVVA